MICLKMFDSLEPLMPLGSITTYTDTLCVILLFLKIKVLK